MELGIESRTAIVTGASRGIGLATVRRLAAEGVRVAAVARKFNRELPDGALGIVADLSTSDGPTAAADAALDALGSIDFLVNNVGGIPAGDEHVGGFLSISDSAWLRTIELNLLSAVRVTRAVLPSLVQRRGVIVNVSSVGARVAAPGVDYGVAKAGLTNLTKALADEFGPAGVRAVTVSPGPTATDI